MAPTATQGLTPDRVEDFVRDGFVVAPEVFPRAVAERARALIWEALDEDPEDRSTWTRERTLARRSLRDAVYDDLFTERLRDVVDDLLGAGRWTEAGRLEYHPVVFPGHAEPPWRAPEQGWHVDGSWFHHYLDGVFQPLVLLPVWGDIEPGDGGPAVKAGSHLEGARRVAAAGADGIDHKALDAHMRAACADLPAREVTARAGDVILLHHFTFHAGSANVGDDVRMISNMYVHLTARPDLTGASGREPSPFERAIRQALTA